MLESDWMTNVRRCVIIFRDTGERSSRQLSTVSHDHITAPSDLSYFKGLSKAIQPKSTNAPNIKYSKQWDKTTDHFHVWPQNYV